MSVAKETWWPCKQGCPAFYKAEVWLRKSDTSAMKTNGIHSSACTSVSPQEHAAEQSFKESTLLVS